MTATRSAAFTTAVRVIDRVLRDTARQRTLAEPAVAAGLAQVGVLVVGVRHRTHRTHALAANVALFARTETHDDETAVTTDDQIGRATWWARVGKYVLLSVVAV